MPSNGENIRNAVKDEPSGAATATGERAETGKVESDMMDIDSGNDCFWNWVSMCTTASAKR